MTDIMKLAEEHAVACSRLGDHYVHTRAALQSAIEALQSKLGDAIQSSAHWQHQFTELQAENERLKRELEISKLDAKEWYSQADALQAKLDELQRQEPVAWHTEDHLTDRSATTYDKGVALRWEGKGWPVTPLYAAPKALEPLTDDWIRERCDQTWVFNTVKQWVSEIEAAHGITKGTP